MIAYSGDEEQASERFTVDSVQRHDRKIHYHLDLERLRSSKNVIAEFVAPLNRNPDRPSAAAGLSRLFVPEGAGFEVSAMTMTSWYIWGMQMVLTFDRSRWRRSHLRNYRP